MAIIIKDIALATPIKIQTMYGQKDMRVAKYHNTYYYYDETTCCYEIVTNYNLIRRLSESVGRWETAKKEAIRINVYSDETLAVASKRLMCFLDNQEILLKVPTFCMVMFVENHLPFSDSVEPVDIVRDSYEINGYPNDISVLINKLKSNSFYKEDILYELAGILSFGGKYIGQTYLNRFFDKFVREYPKESTRRLFFTGLACFNTDKMAERLSSIQNKYSDYILSRNNRFNTVPKNVDCMSNNAEIEIIEE